jgi:hypothetical protein
MNSHTLYLPLKQASQSCLNLQIPFFYVAKKATRLTYNTLDKISFTLKCEKNFTFMLSMFISIANSFFLDTLFSFKRNNEKREDECVSYRKTKTSVSPPRFSTLFLKNINKRIINSSIIRRYNFMYHQETPLRVYHLYIFILQPLFLLEVQND